MDEIYKFIKELNDKTKIIVLYLAVAQSKFFLGNPNLFKH